MEKQPFQPPWGTRSTSSTPYDPGSMYASHKRDEDSGVRRGAHHNQQYSSHSFDRHIPTPPKQIPSQKTFRIDTKVTFSSEFDSGNLTFVREVFPHLQDSGFHGASVSRGNRRFELYIAGDPKPAGAAGPYLDPEALMEANESYRAWYHFYVTGIAPGETIDFVIKNMSNQSININCEKIPMGMHILYIYKCHIFPPSALDFFFFLTTPTSLAFAVLIGFLSDIILSMSSPASLSFFQCWSTRATLIISDTQSS